MNKNRLASSALIAASVAVLFVVAITIAGELYKVTGADGKVVNPIKDFLKALHGHHWVGKGIWAVGVFLVTTIIGFFTCEKNATIESTTRYANILAYTLMTGTIALFAFFVYEYIITH